MSAPSTTSVVTTEKPSSTGSETIPTITESCIEKATQNCSFPRCSPQHCGCLSADKTTERASDELGLKDGLQYCRVQPSPCRHGCCPILESPSPKRSQTPCQYGYHTRRPPSDEIALFCCTLGKIERSGPSLLLRTRCLSWWRREQARYHSKFDGLHPKRFKCWRWESQITAFYGEPHLPDNGSDTVWMAMATDKTFWKDDLGNFVVDSVLTSH